ncbi:MAG: hypothetical protein HQL30_05410 [Candidatus Omnitrophica bacterium]|nr:hypothetical protein [Candidatus Omnitrophota bacterium]
MSDPSVEVLAEIPYLTNQLAEARAFYHAIVNPNPPDYIGFTTHQHNTKFTLKWLLSGFQYHLMYFPNDCIKIDDVDPAIVEKAFMDQSVKVISFFPEQNYLRQAEYAHPGMTKFLLDALQHLGLLNSLKWCEIDKIQYVKFVPICNSFIMPWNEFKSLFSFLDAFIRYINSEYSLEYGKLQIIPQTPRHYGREWGLFVERLLGLYFITRYGYDFKVAFLDNNKMIHRLGGYRYPGLFRKYLIGVSSCYQLYKHLRALFCKYQLD